MRNGTVAILLVMCRVSWADEVTLTNGAKIEGIVREGSRDPKRVEIEVGVGTVSFPRKEVLSVSKGPSALHEYYERWETVKDSRKPEDFLVLATFAEGHRLSKFLRGLMERVILLEPENEIARRRLGYRKYRGTWMSREEVSRAKGLVLFEGRWITTAERELVLGERAEAKLRREADVAERKRKGEEEQRRRSGIYSSPTGHYYRPSEFWPYYYRGPRRVWGSDLGSYSAIPTLDVYTYIKGIGSPGVK